MLYHGLSSVECDSEDCPNSHNHGKRRWYWFANERCQWECADISSSINSYEAIWNAIADSERFVCKDLPEQIISLDCDVCVAFDGRVNFFSLRLEDG